EAQLCSTCAPVLGFARELRSSMPVCSEKLRAMQPVPSLLQPLVEHSPRDQSSGSRPLLGQRSMKILVADDSLFYRRALENAVAGWGYEAVSARDGAEALGILQGDHSPRLALVDWMMPKMEGVEVCQRIRAMEKPEPPYIIVLTAKGGTENIVRALE